MGRNDAGTCGELCNQDTGRRVHGLWGSLNNFKACAKDNGEYI
jgi:hypothetical protein